MAETKQSQEEVFISSLQDALSVLETFGPLAGSMEELWEMLSLAISNRAQARLLMERVQGKGEKGRFGGR